MEPLLISAGVVALAEMGDKTQLLALVLAARFKRPWPIVAGILVATLANHALAGAIGTWLVSVLGEATMRWIVGISFLAMAAWTLVPDKLDADDPKWQRAGGVFATTVLLFFLAEMGDKTQITTVALAARYQSLVQVVAGTTLGMLIADVPVGWLGDAIVRRVPLRLVRAVAAALFAALGIAALFA